jgi:hypothetical protein
MFLSFLQRNVTSFVRSSLLRCVVCWLMYCYLSFAFLVVSPFNSTFVGNTFHLNSQNYLLTNLRLMGNRNARRPKAVCSLDFSNVF